MMLSTDLNRSKLSFMKLFKTRLDNTPGARETVSIIINVEIDTIEFVVSSNKILKEQFKLYEKEKQPRGGR